MHLAYIIHLTEIIQHHPIPHMTEATPERTSSTTPSDQILQRLASARRNLLDLSARNRLLHTPRSSSRSSRLDIVDELSSEIFRILVRERKKMTFLPGKESESSGDAKESTEADGWEYDEDATGAEIPARYVDLKLQTKLEKDPLHRKLLKMFYDARTFEQEQGVNILYLALGFLEWKDQKQSNPRHAPLILIPVLLERETAKSRFKLSWSEEELQTNLSLREKLKTEFGLDLPELPDPDDLDVAKYFSEVQNIIQMQDGWRVDPDGMALWFFSFNKFLMYRDLLPDAWPPGRSLSQNPLVAGLLNEGIQPQDDLLHDDQNIDELLDPIEQTHVVDADSSQALVIEEVRRGKNLVVQGPPGTGKSQTITNIIATAVRERKRVLFVSEKMAALEVVKSRLDAIDLGNMCLELHSHKTNKKEVLKELDRTLGLGRPLADGISKQAAALKLSRDSLNRHVNMMHTPLSASGFTPFEIVGRLTRLRSSGARPADFSLPTPDRWSKDHYRKLVKFIADLEGHLREIGDPQKNPWRGCRLSAITPLDVDRLNSKLPAIVERLDALVNSTNELAIQFGLGEPSTPRDSSAVGQLAQKLIAAPKMDRQSMANPVWNKKRRDINELLIERRELASLAGKIDSVFVELAKTTEIHEARRDLAGYGRSVLRFLFPKYWHAEATLRGLLKSQPPKDVEARIALLDDL